VWDGSKARLLVLAHPPRSDASDKEREAFVDASFGTMTSGIDGREQ
jgi:hypothetical protein